MNQHEIELINIKRWKVVKSKTKTIGYRKWLDKNEIINWRPIYNFKQEHLDYLRNLVKRI